MSISFNIDQFQIATKRRGKKKQIKGSTYLHNVLYIYFFFLNHLLVGYLHSIFPFIFSSSGFFCHTWRPSLYVCLYVSINVYGLLLRKKISSYTAKKMQCFFDKFAFKIFSNSIYWTVYVCLCICTQIAICNICCFYYYNVPS